MHELSITESVLEIVLRHANSANAQHVRKIQLVIGDLASIVDDSVQFYWDIISKDTLAEGATLQFRRLPIELLCLDCQNHFQPETDRFDCPRCGSSRLQIISGREFYVESIDVETNLPMSSYQNEQI
ncbi:MAG: hypA [Chloroflexi bacterium]|nr:hypA [Chloroflexota bacterium]